MICDMRKKEKKRKEKEIEEERGKRKGEREKKMLIRSTTSLFFLDFLCPCFLLNSASFFTRLSSSLGKGLSDPPVPDL